MEAGGGSRMAFFFAWDRSYDLGIDRIDAQHRRIFELLRAIHDGASAGESRAEQLAGLRALQAAVEVHFQEEEELLDVASCPELLRQRGEHVALLEHLSDLERTPTSPSCEALERIRDYVIRHVLVSDRGYAAWLGRAAPLTVASWESQKSAAAAAR